MSVCERELVRDGGIRQLVSQKGCCGTMRNCCINGASNDVEDRREIHRNDTIWLRNGRVRRAISAA